MTVKEFFEKLNGGATWSAGVSFKRANPLPLDRYSVFASNEEANTYASTNPVAYPGQVIAVVSDSEASNVYYINEKMALQPIGIIPVGEEGAIEVSPEGKITLHGFAEAGGLTLPQKQPDGTLKWVAISEVVKGDGNTVTEGDQKSIDSTGDEKKVIASLHGFKEATEGQIAHKVGDALVWKDEYKYDDAQVKADIQANKEAAAANAKVIETHTSSLETVTNQVTKIETSLGEGGTVNQEITNITQNVTEITSQVTNLESQMAERPTNDEVDTKVSEAIAAVDHLKRVVLESEAGLPAIEEADLNTIYMVPKAAKALVASDSYNEYMAINGKWEIIGDTTVDLSDYAKTSTVTALSERVNTVEATANAAATAEALNAYIAKNDAAVKLKADQTALDTANQNIEKKLDSETAASTYATQSALTEGLSTKLDASEISKYQTTEAASTESSRLEGIINKKADTATVEALDGRVSAAESNVQELQGTIDGIVSTGGEKNVINSVSAEFNVSENRELSVVAIDKSKITGLTEALAGKVSAADGQRLMTTEEGTKLEHIALLDGQASFDGSVLATKVTGLDNWVKTNRDKVAGLISTEKETKLDGIAAGAQVNTIESVKIEGQSDALAISKKAVTIPAATLDKLGLVKLSSTIGTDSKGALEVKSMSVNKLTQLDEDTLILDGGNATK